jgi:hypothetical protein
MENCRYGTVNMTVLHPFYQALASGRHLNELIVLFLLVGLLFDGYAILSAASAINKLLHRRVRNEGPPTEPYSHPHGNPPAQSSSSSQVQ